MSSGVVNNRVRNAYAISTASVSLVLFLIGSVGYLIMNAQKATDSIIENIKVSVLLNDNMSKGAVDSLKTDLGKQEGINNIRYISKDQAAKEFKEFLGKDFLLLIEENPLPQSLELTLGREFSDTEHIHALRIQLKKEEGVDDILYQENIVDQVLKNIYQFKLILLAFGAALLFISILLINNTIRMSVFSKRFLIRTMKLVGATNGFIRKPFVKMALGQGFLSAFLASSMLLLLILGLKEGLPEIRFIIDQWNMFATLIGGMFLLGIFICILSTLISVNKYINMDSNDLHVY